MVAGRHCFVYGRRCRLRKREFHWLPEDRGRLNIFFYIVNASKLPLLFHSAQIAFENQRISCGSKRELVPNDSYYVCASIEFNAMQTEKYRLGNIQVDFIGVMFYQDASQNERIQIFGRTCMVGVNKEEFLPYQGTMPQTEQYKI